MDRNFLGLDDLLDVKKKLSFIQDIKKKLKSILEIESISHTKYIVKTTKPNEHCKQQTPWSKLQFNTSGSFTLSQLLYQLPPINTCS